MYLWYLTGPDRNFTFCNDALFSVFGRKSTITKKCQKFQQRMNYCRAPGTGGGVGEVGTIVVG